MNHATKHPFQAGPPRILVVEDQESVRELTRAMLVNAGYEVAVAADGAEAVAAVRTLPFDLVLMDVDMPVMDGLTATRQIRQLEGLCSKVPVIAFSGKGPGPVAAGADDHLAKPFRKADLLLKVARWLDRSDDAAPTPPACAPPSGGGILDEACDLMGRPWAVRGVKRLVTQIDEMFGASPDLTRDEGQLEHQAHGLVSLSALLGFASLSESCSTLEDACRNRLGVQLPFDRARSEAMNARTVALGLIAGFEAETS